MLGLQGGSKFSPIKERVGVEPRPLFLACVLQVYYSASHLVVVVLVFGTGGARKFKV